MLLLAILLILIFAGAGFAYNILWWGLIIGLVLLVAGVVSGGGPRGPGRYWW